MAYTVTAPLVVAVDDEGRQHYAYEKQALPEFVKGDQLKRFVDEGLVAEADASSEEPKTAAKK